MEPGIYAPAGEYDGYAHHIVSMVVHGASHEELTEHLGALDLGITGAPQRERDERFATEILDAVRE